MGLGVHQTSLSCGRALQGAGGTSGQASNVYGARTLPKVCRESRGMMLRGPGPPAPHLRHPCPRLGWPATLGALQERRSPDCAGACPSGGCDAAHRPLSGLQLGTAQPGACGDIAFKSSLDPHSVSYREHAQLAGPRARQPAAGPAASAASGPYLATQAVLARNTSRAYAGCADTGQHR